MPGRIYRRPSPPMSRADWAIAVGAAIPMAAMALAGLVWWVFG